MSNLTGVAGNGDADPDAGIRTSKVTFEAAARQTYAIAVAGNGSLMVLTNTAATVPARFYRVAIE